MSVRIEARPISIGETLGAASTPTDKMLESVARLAMDVVSADVVSTKPEYLPEVNVLAARLAAITDPQAILFAAQACLRDADAGMYKGVARQGDLSAELHHKNRMEMLRKAERAARKAKRPKFLRKLLKVVMVAAGAAAAAFTGGAALGLAIAGATLMLTGDHIVKGLVEAGIVPKSAATWVALCLKVAGSALLAVAGNAEGISNLANAAKAGTSSAEAAVKSAQTANQVVQTVESLQTANLVVQTVGTVTSALIEARSAYWDHQSASAELSAHEYKIVEQVAEGHVDDAVEGLKDAYDRFKRVSERLIQMGEAQGKFRHASTQLLA